MPRARLLKPEFFDDEKLAEIPFTARILFQALWALSDRDGRLEDRPEKIAAFAFPYDKPLQIKARKEAPKMLDLLIDAGFVERYQSEGKACLWLPHFKDHQKTHDREAQSVLPPAPGDTRRALGEPRLALGVKSLPEAEAVTEAKAEAVREAEAVAGAPSAAFGAKPVEERDFPGQYVWHYEQREGKHPGGAAVAAASEIERQYGRDACVQVAADLNWEKPPNYLRPILEDRANGRVKAHSGSGRRNGTASVDDPTGIAEWERYAAGD